MPARSYRRPRSLVANPPAWLTAMVAKSWDGMSKEVPPAWMPQLQHMVGHGKTVSADLKEYGCGAYGCVFPTLDPNIVLKLTTDDTEAQFAATIANKLPIKITTIYQMVYELPDQKRKVQGSELPVFLLWREAADDVGKIDTVVGSHAEDAINEQHQAAQFAFDLIQSGLPAEDALASWREYVAKMGQVSELRWLSDGMLEAYDQMGVFFGDIHGGNLGRARGHWVITDPGHVVVLDRKSHPAPRDAERARAARAATSPHHWPAPGAARPPQINPTRVSDLGTLADTINHAAITVGDSFTRKAFIAAVYAELADKPVLQGEDIDDFKATLLRLRKLGRITLARCDIPRAYNTDLVRDSETIVPGTGTVEVAYHFIVAPAS